MSLKMSNILTSERLRRLKKPSLPALIVAGGVVVVGLLVVALPARERKMPPSALPPVNVVLRPVVPIEALDDTITLHGVVKPNRLVRVAAEVTGQIKRVGLRKTPITWRGRSFEAGQPLLEGEPIVEGDAIVILDTELLQAEYDRAKAQADFDQRDYERKSDLFEKNVATKSELDQAKTTMAVSQAVLARARLQLEHSTIVAPISGILNDLPDEVGEYVQPGMCVGEIVDMEIAKVVADVPEKDVHFLHAGEAVEVLIDPLDGRAVNGEITFISQLADDQTRTTPIEVSIKNGQGLLRSGQIVTVHLKRQTLHDVIMVPLEVVIPLEQGGMVYVAKDGVAERRDVKLGFMKGTEVQILSGLSAGDALIVSGQRYVGPGQLVRAADPAPGSVASAQTPELEPASKYPSASD